MVEIYRFADKQSIALAIDVERLQYNGYLPWNPLNNLKARLEWVEN